MAPAPASRALSASFGATIAIQLLNVATGILLARTFGPQNRGAVAAAMLWPSVLSAIGQLGLSESATYHAARGRASVGRLLGSGLGLWAAQSVVFVALGAAILPLVLGRQSQETVQNAYLFLAFIPLSTGALLLMGLLNGLHRYRAFQVLRFVAVGGTALALFALAALGELSVRVAVVCHLAGTLLAGMIAVVLVFGAERTRPSFDRAVAREMLGYGVRSHASTISLQFNERADQLVISAFLAPALLGLYVVAVTLAALTNVVGHSIGYVALPLIARLGSEADRARSAARMVSLALFLSLAATIPVIVFAPALIKLFFGSDFAAAATPARVLLVAAVLLSTNRTMEAVFRGVGRPLDAGVAELIALGVTFAGLATLLPALGLTGAALASLVAYGVSAAWMLRRAKTALGTTIRQILIPRRSDLIWVADRLSALRTRP